MIYRYFNIIFFLFFGICSFSQNLKTKADFKKDSLKFEEYWVKAESFFYENKVDKSTYYLKKASGIAHQIKLYDLWADCEMQIASFSSYEGDYINTFKILDSLEILIDTYPFANATVSKIYNFKGIFLGAEGDIAKAIEYDEKSFSVKEKEGASALDRSIYYSNIGKSYADLGKYEQALVNYQLSIKELAKAHENSLIDDDQYYGRNCIIGNNLSEAYRLNGEKDKALEYAKIANRDLVNLNHAYLALQQRNQQVLAESYLAIGDLEKSKIHQLKRLELIKSDSRKNIQERLKTILAIASLHDQLNEKDLAKEQYIIAENHLDSLKTNTKALYFAYSPLIKYHLSNSDLEKSKNLLDRSLGEITAKNTDSYYLEFGGDISHYAQLLGLKGRYFFEKYQLTNDSDLLEKSIEWYTTTYMFVNNASQRLGGILNPKFIQILDEINENALETYYSAISKSPSKESYLRDVLSIIEFDKSFNQNVNLTKTQADILIGIPKPLYNAQLSHKKELSRLMLQLKNEKSDSLLEVVNFKMKKLDSVTKTITENYPKYNALKYYDFELDYDKLKAKIKKEDVALLSFYYSDSYLYRLLITPYQTTFNRVEITPAFLTNIKAHVRAITNFESNNYKETGITLYNILFKDIEAVFKTKKLVIVPHKSLNYIPFESLYVDGESLLNKVTIAYRSSLFNWVAPNLKKGEEDKEVLLMAPVFPEKTKAKNNNRQALSELIYSLEEVKYIEDIFKAKPLYLDDATKENFITNKDHDIIHLATHVDLNSESPFETKIMFAKDSDDVEALFMHEIINMQLSAKMVVLSACETGIGEVKKGMGVESLAKAFSNAGAKSTVMSLWKVDDRSTSEIMKLFYKHLDDGYSKDVALRKAKSDYLSSTDDNLLKHPYYWAGFVISGDTSPVVSTNYWIWVIVIASIFILLVLLGKKLFKRI